MIRAITVLSFPIVLKFGMHLGAALLPSSLPNFRAISISLASISRVRNLRSEVLSYNRNRSLARSVWTCGSAASQALVPNVYTRAGCVRYARAVRVGTSFVPGGFDLINQAANPWNPRRVPLPPCLSQNGVWPLPEQRQGWEFHGVRSVSGTKPKDGYRDPETLGGCGDNASDVNWL